MARLFVCVQMDTFGKIRMWPNVLTTQSIDRFVNFMFCYVQASNQRAIHIVHGTRARERYQISRNKWIYKILVDTKCVVVLSQNRARWFWRHSNVPWVRQVCEEICFVLSSVCVCVCGVVTTIQFLFFLFSIFIWNVFQTPETQLCAS